MKPTMDPRNFTGAVIYIPREVCSFSVDGNVVLAIFVIKLKDSTLDTIAEKGVPKITAPGESGILTLRPAHLSTFLLVETRVVSPICSCTQSVNLRPRSASLHRRSNKNNKGVLFLKF
jgi:hypothetical protein